MASHTQMSCSSAADNVFGPVVASCRNEFDFTLLFEQSILGLVPALFFLLFGPIRLRSLYKASSKTMPAATGYMKLLGAGVFLTLHLSILILWATKRSLQTRVSIVYASFSFLASLLFIVLCHLEHTRSVKPSTLLSSFLFFTLLFDIAQARTLMLRGNRSIASLFLASMGVKLLLLVLEEKGKRSILKGPHKQLPKETTSGVFSRSLFWWLNPLFLGAFRRFIKWDDLPEIDSKLSTTYLTEDFERRWVGRSKPETRWSLGFALGNTLFGPMMAIVLPRLALIGFTFAQPFLIERILSFLYEGESSVAEWQGLGLVAATALTYLGIAISTAHFRHALYRSITMFRGTMIAIIYRHTLTLRSNQNNDFSPLTLMSTDIDRIVLCFENIPSVWARFIEVVIAVTLLILQMGWVAVIPLVVVALSSLGNTVIAKMIGDRQKRWVQAIQRRVTVTGSILKSMKNVKMMGLKDPVTTAIQNERIRETEYQASYRWMSVWLNLIAETPISLAPVCTFAAYVLSSGATQSSFDITKAFTVLSIISLLTAPAEDLLASIPAVASGLGSYDRIQNFLVTPSWEDERTLLVKMRENDTFVPLAPVDHSRKAVLHPTEIPLDTFPNPGSPVISVKNATIRPALDASPAVSNVSFSMKQGSILMIVGPIGAGKSTLVKALLGELGCDRGEICVRSPRVSYCAQTPWLFHGTIKQNICGGEEPSKTIDETWYRTVVKACALDVDISRFAMGDHTVIGNNGISLSGGQRQRIALARALYLKNDIFIFDDVFSALDASTQQVVFQATLGPNGLVRKLNSTAVLVTHTANFLSHSNSIIVLDANGGITHSGSYEELRTQKAFVHDTLEHKPEFDEDSPSVDLTDKDSILNAQLSRPPPPEPVPDEPQMVGLSIYGYYMGFVGWRKAGVFAGSAALAVFSSAFAQVWLDWWANAAEDQLNIKLGIYFLLSFLQILGQGICYWAILVLIAPSTGRKLHLTLLRTVMGACQSFLDKTDPGILLNRFSQDMTLVETPLSIGALFMVYNGFMVLSQIGLIASGSYYITATIPFLLTVVYLLQGFYLRTSRQLQILDLEARSPLYSHFLETADGLTTIRAFGLGSDYERANIRHVDHSQRPYYLLYCIQRWLNLVLDLIVAAMAILVVGLAIKLRGSISPGLLGISLNNILSLNTNLQSFITGWTQFETSLSAVARVRSFEISTAQEENSSEHEPPSEWPQRGSIVIRNLTATYDGITPALRDVNLTISPGEKIAIRGRTGSGKSTLLSALLHLINPTAGHILVDDISLSTLSCESIRKCFLTIPQDSLILPGSVRFNVDPWGRFPDALIIQALEKVHLWPNPLAVGDKSTLDTETATETPVNDNLHSVRCALDAPLSDFALSEGQAQLLALARILLRKDDSKVVLLDEATSSVDANTEKLMWDILCNEFPEHTIVNVTHRMETLVYADRVVVMDQGRVEEVHQAEGFSDDIVEVSEI